MGQYWVIICMDAEVTWGLWGKLGEFFWHADASPVITWLTKRIFAPSTRCRGWSVSEPPMDIAASLERTKSPLLKLPVEIITMVFRCFELSELDDALCLCLVHDYLGQIGESVCEDMIYRMISPSEGHRIVCMGDNAYDDDFPPQIRDYLSGSGAIVATSKPSSEKDPQSTHIEGHKAQGTAGDPRSDVLSDKGRATSLGSINKMIQQTLPDVDGQREDKNDDDNSEENPRYFLRACGFPRARCPEDELVSMIMDLQSSGSALEEDEKRRLSRLLRNYQTVVGMPAYGDSILLNTSKGEYVRADAVEDLNQRLHEADPNSDWTNHYEVTLGQALLSMICWSSDPSCAMCCDSERLARGPWAGDKFVVTTLDSWNTEGDNTVAWRDVSDEVVEWLEALWKSDVRG